MKNIDFRNGQPLVMMVSQYDYGYNLQIALWSNGAPVTITAASVISENFTTACTFSGNVVTIPVTTSMTEQFGHFPAELRVTDSLGQVSSKNFDFFVERSPLAVKSTQTYEGDIVEFTAKRVPLNSVVVTMVPIQSGSGDPSPTNVRPITGRTGASVVVSGKNLADDGFTWNINASGVIENSTLYNSSVVGVKKDEQYVQSINGALANVGVIAFYTEYPSVGSQSYDSSRIVNPGSPIFTAPIDGYAVIRNASSATNIQIERGSTVTDYEPYKGTVYPITFTSAGTVYAGTVDLVSGVLTVDRSLWDLKNRTWGKDSTAFYTQINEIARPPLRGNGGMMCNAYPTIADGTPYANMEDMTCALYNVTLTSNPNKNWVYIKDSRYSTAADFKTYIDALDAIYVCAKLAAPLTYNLTPTQVKSLLGENVVWSPDGEVTVVVPEYY